MKLSPCYLQHRPSERQVVRRRDLEIERVAGNEADGLAHLLDQGGIVRSREALLLGSAVGCSDDFDLKCLGCLRQPQIMPGDRFTDRVLRVGPFNSVADRGRHNSAAHFGRRVNTALNGRRADKWSGRVMNHYDLTPGFKRGQTVPNRILPFRSAVDNSDRLWPGTVRVEHLPAKDLALGSHDNDDAPDRLNGRKTPQGMHENRLAGNGQKRFGQLALQPRALSRGNNDNIDVHTRCLWRGFSQLLNQNDPAVPD